MEVLSWFMDVISRFIEVTSQFMEVIPSKVVSRFQRCLQRKAYKMYFCLFPNISFGITDVPGYIVLKIP